jgi:hypothetical protein
MSGGASEYMAAYRENTIGSSGFSTDELTLYADYLDVYNASSSINSYQYRILGDATGENGPFYYFKYNGWYSYFNNWYQDYSNFVESNYPWFNRGGDYGDLAGAGQFSFFRDTGEAVADYSTRLVLAI